MMIRIENLITLLFWLPIFASCKEFSDPFEPSNLVAPTGIENGTHRWDDQIVEPDNKHQDFIKFSGNDGIALKNDSIRFTFSVDKKQYMDSLKQEDLNRGVILISGNPKSPVIYCWMRPFMFTDAKAIFIVTVPTKEIENIFFAFIPLNENRRYLYKASAVLKHFK